MKITIELELKDLLELASLRKAEIKQETKRSKKVDIKPNVDIADEDIRYLANNVIESLTSKISTDCRSTVQV